MSLFDIVIILNMYLMRNKDVVNGELKENYQERKELRTTIPTKYYCDIDKIMLHVYIQGHVIII